MPTLLDLCNIQVPDTVEGRSLFEKERRDFLYGEISEGYRATRMIRMENYKLIYYPYGNKIQIFDILQDKNELHDLSDKDEFKNVKEEMLIRLCSSLYGKDREEWIKNGKLVGLETPDYKERGIIHCLISEACIGLYKEKGLDLFKIQPFFFIIYEIILLFILERGEKHEKYKTY